MDGGLGPALRPGFGEPGVGHRPLRPGTPRHLHSSPRSPPDQLGRNGDIPEGVHRARDVIILRRACRCSARGCGPWREPGRARGDDHSERAADIGGIGRGEREAARRTGASGPGSGSTAGAGDGVRRRRRRRRG
ncbi:hypothetical protein P376_5147 [Streptomyces sp. HCCB10043]|nr:hypothetical protein P376_5147 [Streptomyces sp. HCCB10043]EWS94636.1 hypothetical protein SSIG_05297 [Streptomyces filamentosus NRRL 11379]